MLDNGKEVTVGAASLQPCESPTQSSNDSSFQLASVPAPASGGEMVNDLAETVPDGSASEPDVEEADDDSIGADAMDHSDLAEENGAALEIVEDMRDLPSIVDEAAYFQPAPERRSNTSVLIADDFAAAGAESFHREARSAPISRRGVGMALETRRTTRVPAASKRDVVHHVDKVQDVPVNNSLYDTGPDKPRVPRGAAGLMGRSFRVGWGPNGQLIRPGQTSNKQTRVAGTPAQLQVTKVMKNYAIAQVRPTAASDKELQSQLMQLQQNKSVGQPVFLDDGTSMDTGSKRDSCPRIISFAFEQSGGPVADVWLTPAAQPKLNDLDALQMKLNEIYQLPRQEGAELEFEIEGQKFVVDVKRRLLVTASDDGVEVEYTIKETTKIPKAAVVLLVKSLGECLKSRVVENAPSLEVARQNRQVLNSAAIFRLFDALWGAPELEEVGFDGNPQRMQEQRSILRDVVAETEGRSELEAEMMRRDALTAWLSEICGDEIPFHGSTAPPHAQDRNNRPVEDRERKYLIDVFKCLTLDKVPEAAEIARGNRDYRLAMLIASTPGTQGNGGDAESPGVWTLLREQLSQWADDDGRGKANKYIHDLRLRIYALLAGKREDDGLHVCEGLDWKRAFALHLWYFSTEGVDGALMGATNIEVAVGDYSAAAADTTYERVAQPLPFYHQGMAQDSPGHILTAAQDRHVSKDTCFHLLELWSEREQRARLVSQMLCPTTYGESPIDYHISWHLCLALEGMELASDAVQMTQLHLGYAAQLEALGLWHWAVYVLLHLDGEVAREHAVRELLRRNCKCSGMTLREQELSKLYETFIVDNLRVPVSWIYEAEALHAKYIGDDLLQVERLIEAGMFSDAHSVVVGSLASEIIAKNGVSNRQRRRLRSRHEENGVERLKAALASLERAQSDGDINSDEWTRGGGIYHLYLNLDQAVDEHNGGANARERLFYWCENARNMESTTSTQRMCYAQMSTRVIKTLRELGAHVATLATPLEGLTMAEDDRFDQLGSLTAALTMGLAA